MKMFTAAAALESKVVTPNTPDRGQSARSGSAAYTVRNADHRAMGRIPFRDVIAYSRNVAIARTAARLGRNTQRAAATLYKTWRKLGIGQQTGIDLAGEVVGLVRDPGLRPWAPIDLANRRFGQGVATTPIQLATAFTPMINGGIRVQPHFLVAIDGRGQAVTPPAAGAHDPGRRTSSSASWTTSRARVPWYAEGSLIPRYRSAARPARRRSGATPKHRYDRDMYNFSFVGYVGGDEPAAVVAVRIEEADPRVPRAGRAGPEHQVVRAVPARRAARHQHPRSAQVIRSEAGRPEPGSGAERVLDPARYARRIAWPRRVAVTVADAPRATMPPIVSDGQLSYPPADPTSLTAIELAAAVGGRLVRAGQFPIRGGAVDSRLVRPGQAFFALPGERTDGHRFLDAAIAAGAAALVVGTAG